MLSVIESWTEYAISLPFYQYTVAPRGSWGNLSELLWHTPEEVRHTPEEVGHIITCTALRQSRNTWPLQPSSTC